MQLTVAEEDVLGLSGNQQLIWIDQAAHPDLPGQNIGASIEVMGHVCPIRLERALNEIARTHDALRIVIGSEGGRPFQQLLECVDVKLRVIDADAGAGSHWRDTMDVEFRQLFSLQPSELPWSCTLLRISPQHSCVFLRFHHIIMDGVGVGMLCRALSDAYLGVMPARAPGSFLRQIQDHRKYLASERFQRDHAYWLGRYPDGSSPALAPMSCGASTAVGANVIRFPLGRAVYNAITERASSSGCSVSNLILSFIGLYFARTNGEGVATVGLAIHNRDDAASKATAGMLASVLLVDIDLRASTSLSQLLDSVARCTKQGFRHRRLPLIELKKSLAQERRKQRLFDVSVSFESFGEKEGYFGGDAHAVALNNGCEQTPLAFYIRDYDPDADLVVDVSFNGELLSTVYARQIAVHIQHLLTRLPSISPGVDVNTLSIMPLAERDQVVHEFNPVARGYRCAPLVHHAFETHARTNPGVVAIEFDGVTLSYGELDCRANQIAHVLQASGAGPDRCVGICFERGLDMIAGLLGILKAGAAYLPLDPSYPAERLAFMLHDCQPMAVLTGRSLRPMIEPIAAGMPVISVDTPRIAGAPTHAPAVPALDAHHLAYVIYTSGSTGQPKGVMVEHGQVARLFAATDAQFQFGPEDVWTLFHSFAFDFSVWEIWGALLYGGRLVVVPAAVSRSPRDFHALLIEQGVTVLNQTPSAFRQLIAAEADSTATHRLRYVIFGGEALDLPMLAPWIARNDPDQTQLINMYGITEITVHATFRRIERRDVQGGQGSLIGRPLSDLRILVLDPHQQPVPIGVTGELYVGGDGIARGYLNRPELTAERFLPDPYSSDPSARLYRTGDLGRWLPGGELQYVGRNDFQVKIRGFRIELAEIEARLQACDGVREAVVLAREDSPGDKRLVGYVITEPESDPSAAELRDHLLLHLADYMVPAAFVRVHHWPLTSNGKLDRAALPAPDASAVAARGYEAPVGETELAIAAVWQEVLGLEQVGRHDNFFELGGHSLLAITVIEQLRHRGLQADVRTVFNALSLVALAESVRQQTPQASFEVPPSKIDGSGRITPDLLPLASLEQTEIDTLVAAVREGAVGIQDIYPLGPLQEGVLFHHLLGGEGDAYLLRSVLRFDDLQCLQAFLVALEQVMARHDILRTSIHWESLRAPVQVVHRSVTLPVHEIALDPRRAPLEQLMQRVDPRCMRIDLRRAPLLHAHIASDMQGEAQWLVLLLHHIVCDHVTLQLLLEEVQIVLRGDAAALSEPLQYRNFISVIRDASAGDHEAHFRAQLSDIHESTAPYGVLDVQGTGAEVTEISVTVPDVLSTTLHHRARALGITPAAVFHLAWAQVLAALCDQNTVVFGTVLSGRLQMTGASSNVMGVFVNTLPVRIDVGNTTARQAALDTHATLIELLEHEQAPLVVAQRCSAIDPRLPLFTSVLNYRHGQGDSEGLAAHGAHVVLSEERANYPIVVSVDSVGEAFSISMQCAEGINAEELASRLLQATARLCEALSDTVPRPLQELRLVASLDSIQRQQALLATTRAYPRDGLIHHVFQEQVRAQPEAVAADFHGATLSYQQLDRRANQVAQVLRANGAGPDRCVAICSGRRLEFIVGLLGILKAGAAYVPLDPDYPVERLGFMLEDCQPVAVLTWPEHHARIQALVRNTPVIALDDPRFDAAPTDAPDVPGLESQHLAYVMYTSGSTGQPKGVMVEHRNVLRLAINNGFASLGPSDVVAHCANPAFDAATWEIWGALLVGARVQVVAEQVALDPVALDQALRAAGVTALWLTAGLFNAHADALTDAFAGLRYLLVGGDVLDPDRIGRVLAQSTPPQHLLNGYGPTESTTFASTHLIEQVEPGRSIPIGRPIGNTQIHLLAPDGQPVLPGVIGEVYIGGDGVARGYLNQPELSAERFLADPYRDDPSARLYRSGDLARWLDDGTLEFIGRTDFQLKLRGYRIEPGEIETHLRTCAGVREAVVIAREDTPGDKRLVAYVLAEGQSPPAPELLRAHLAQKLADYMLPSAFVTVPHWPLTSNGKLDRRALPAPDIAAVVAGRYEAPVGEVEQALAILWQEVLGLERVGRHDSFFALGGHSLRIITVIERLRQQGLHVEVRAAFSASTLAELAACVQRTQHSTEVLPVPPNLIDGNGPITPEHLTLLELSQKEIDGLVALIPGGSADIQDIYPLGPLQEGVLFHHLLGGEGDAYLLRSITRIETEETLQAFLSALRQVIARHDILRTSVHWEGLPRPVQVVHRQVSLPVERIILFPDVEPADQLRQQVDPRRIRMDLGRPPLIQAFTAADPQGDGHWLVLLVHHLVCDHISLELLIDEVQAFMRGDSAGLPAPLPYRSFIAKALATPDDVHAAYFREQLGDVEEPTAPFGVLDVHRSGAQVAEIRQTLPPALSFQLRSQARQWAVTPAALFHLAWGQVLARCCGRGDAVFGTVVSGRLQGLEGASRVVGMFINTLPLRLQLDGLDVGQAVLHAHKRLSELLDHEQASLVQAQRCSQVAAPLPLFTSLLNYRHSEATTAVSVFEGMHAVHDEERTNYPLTVSVDDLGEDFGTVVQVVQGLDAARIAAYFAQALESLAHALEQRHDLPVLKLELATAEESSRRQQALLATTRAYPRDGLIHHVFQEQVRAQPEAVAADFHGATLSYQQLDRRANQVAQVLRANGAGPDRCVAICSGRRLEFIVGLLGILKAGAAYVPLDPDYPVERLGFMLEDCQPVAVLTWPEHHARIQTLVRNTPVIALDDPRFDAAPIDVPDVPGLGSQHLAYVMYTSGSTGQPKGVMVEHRNVLRLAINNGFASLGPSDVVAHCANPAFDAATWEIWGALLVGARVQVVAEQVALDPVALDQALRAAGVTALWLTAGLFNAHADALTDAFAGLRYLLVGGDVLDPDRIGRVLAQSTPPQHLLNGYGPTESTTFASTHLIEQVEPGRSIPIGRPIGNTQIHLLAPDGQPVLPGVIGEVYIGGDGVARGYLNQPELSAERFLADPYRDDPSARLYRSGDLARWLDDGTLEFIGRTDFQLKLRGYRIEPGEIETHLRTCAGVREAVVIAREDTPGDKRLVAYVLAEGQSPPAPELLRAHLAQKLADYMLPSAFVTVPHWPLTSNGKLDRRALPAPDIAAVVAGRYEAPVGEVEQALATLWQEVLGLERVGRGDDFFALGGHSLRIITVIERLRQQGLHVEVRAAFSASTLAELAACVQRTQHSTEVLPVPPNLIDGNGPITPEHLTLLELSQKEIDGLVALIPGGSADIQDIYPLGPLQEGVLFHHLLGGEGDAYLLRSITRIETEETLQAFLSALRQVIARHDILRTSVHWEGLPRPVQVVHRQVSLPVERIILFPDVEPADQLRQQVDPRRIRMDLGRPPLIQAFTAADPQGDGHWLVLLVHHLVCDHISLELLIDEVQAFMRGDSAGLPAPLPYRSFIAKALATPDDVHAAYFREQLGDVEEPTAPFGVLDVHRSGAQVAEIRQTLPPALSFQLRSQARQWAVTPAALFHLAWGQVLARCCGRGDAVFGTVVSGRLQGLEGASRVVGMFINTLPLRLQLDGLDVGQAVLHAHKRLSELLDHEQASLVQAQRCSQVAAPLPLFTSLLNYRHSEATTAVSVFEGMHAVHDEERTNYPLTVSVDDLGEDFGTVVQVVQGLDAARIAAYFAQALESLAHALEKQPQQPVHTLEILPAAEREAPFVTDVAPQLMAERTITACFEAVVVRQPNQAAVVMADQTLSFDQLNRRANQLAHVIHAMGVIPGDRVAIFSARGVELLIAVLAVLKVGAAYVPLDPTHPASRIGYMLADSTPSAVLSTAAAAPLLQSLALSVPVVLLDDVMHASQPDCNPQQESLTSRNLAYVIYTSGSTGQPKGVMVEHQSVIRLWRGLNAEVFAHCPGVDRVSMNASLSFDASVQMWIQLLSGRCVVLIPQEVRLDADALLSYIDAHAIDMLDCTPAQLDGLLEAGLLDKHRAHPDAVLVGGDVLTAGTWQQLQRSPRVQFFNVYGPTECTVDATVARIRADSGRPNIGYPLPQVRVCLRDQLGRPVPRGVTGEILLGGGQLARGYLGQPTLTAERFAEDPAAGDTHQAAPGPGRLYRTGDLARLLDDGSYEYLGRNDHQVKIRGVRIELGEVESQLLQHPGIDQVIVTAREDYPRDRRLVAYFTSTAAEPPLAAELREVLARHLSEPMVPSAFVLMPHWPLSPNGKIDRNGLPVPDSGSMSARCNEPPRGDAETAVAQIWQDVLGLPQVGRYDRFFELGGHSLSAIQVVVRLRRKFDVEIPMADLFAHNTVEALARHVVDTLMAKIDEEDMARLSDGLDDLSEAELLDLLEKEDQR